jgi:hypothetical protein
MVPARETGCAVKTKADRLQASSTNSLLRWRREYLAQKSAQNTFAGMRPKEVAKR